jgi:CPA2 family monovalent cation:H+ antiporter-2
MPYGYSLITTLVAGFVLAFLFGVVANRLRLSPLVGYIVAGILVGPFTPGFVADVALAPQLAEVGVILLMFGVGLHFSPRELLDVRHIAIPGALGQIGLATVLGWALGLALGLPQTESLFMGFAVSVASTVVLARALEERGAIKSPSGHLAIGWLIVEDLVIVLALVLLPLAAGAGEGGGVALDALLVLLKVAVFLALMWVVGARVLPAALVALAHERSRELFTLGVLAIALGIAWLAYFVFAASFALGAFVAGLVLAASPLGHAAAERSLPLRDAFAVLFFVSVGMQFDPRILIDAPLAVLGLFLVVIVSGVASAVAISAIFRLGRPAAATLSASFSQAGEFSFILAALGVTLGLLTRSSHDVILAAALLSIAVNPVLFALADRLQPPPTPTR